MEKRGKWMEEIWMKGRKERRKEERREASKQGGRKGRKERKIVNKERVMGGIVDGWMNEEIIAKKYDE